MQVQSFRNSLVRNLCTAVLLSFFTVSGSACGGGSGRENPTPPEAIAEAILQIVDVGQRVQLDGSKSETVETDDVPAEDGELTFSWRISRGGVDPMLDDYCADFPLASDGSGIVCDENDDDTCFINSTVICNDNQTCQDIDILDDCNFNSGSSSVDCPTGLCRLENADANALASFVADAPGPFEIRLVVASFEATDIDTLTIDTFPSLYVVGSLHAFGGTEGGSLGALPDAETFAADATFGLSNPVDGNLILIDSQLGVLREFDLVSGELVGAFGSTDGQLDDPVAAAFDANAQLYVAQADGKVLVFDGTTGLLVKRFGNIGAGVTDLAFSSNGNLLAVDGQNASGVRVFDTNGNALGALGDTQTAVGAPVDLAVLAHDGGLLYIADADGDVIVCDEDGENCESLGDVASLLGGDSPSSVATNPSFADTDADVLIGHPDAGRVIACTHDGSQCGTFGETGGVMRSAVEPGFVDLFFAPPVTPTTTSSTTTTTLDTTTTTSSSTTTTTLAAP